MNKNQYFDSMRTIINMSSETMEYIFGIATGNHLYTKLNTAYEGNVVIWLCHLDLNNQTLLYNYLLEKKKV